MLAKFIRFFKKITDSKSTVTSKANILQTNPVEGEKIEPSLSLFSLPNTQTIKFLDETFTIILIEEDVTILFRVRTTESNVIEVNKNHPFLENEDDTQGRWSAICVFVPIWGKAMLLAQSGITRSHLEEAIKEIGKADLHFNYVKNAELPITTLMQFDSSESILRLNEQHPLLEYTYQKLSAAEKIHFFNLLFVWAAAEQNTLSKSIQRSILLSLQLIGEMYFYLIHDLIEQESQSVK